MKTARIKKDKSTPEKIKFWSSAEAALEEIKGWPEWKQSYVSAFLLGGTDELTGERDRPGRKKK
jgi:hypothetical protein